MSKNKALSENKKLEITELYNKGELSVGAIAEHLDVSLRSVHNYKNYGYEDAVSPVSSMSMEEKPSQSKKGQWECKSCGYITDRKVNICPQCWKGPFHSFFTKIGSPGYVPYVAPQKEPEITEPEKEFCDTTRDYWVCKECDHLSNTEFDICPECGCEEVIFAPDGKEPRDPVDHTKSNEDISVDEIESNEEELEEKKEFDYECYNCHEEFDGKPERCPHCGSELEWSDGSSLWPVLALGGLGLVSYLAYRHRTNNQNWSQPSWNNQGTPWINRLFNNQNQVL